MVVSLEPLDSLSALISSLVNPQGHQLLRYSFVDTIISCALAEVECLVCITPEINQNPPVFLWPGSSTLDAGLLVSAGQG